MIAVAFWGLTRSTQHTAESIHRHILAKLPPHRVFVHTYSSATPYRNARAGENASHIQADYAALRPYQVQVEDLDEVKARIDLNAYRNQPDPWGTNYEAVDNFVLAMYSKNKVTEMIGTSGLDFATVIFVRPDVRYLADVPPLLTLAGPDAWVIPSFQLYSNFNDRFCIASKGNYMVYGNVFPLLLRYSKMKRLHSETFYADLARAAGVRLVYAPPSFVFQRVRTNGQTDPRDLLLHKPVHRVRRQTANAGQVHLHHGVFGNRPLRHPFAARGFVDGVGPV